MHAHDLNDKAVLKLAAPASGQTFYRDARQKGLALRVTAAGARAFVVLHWDAERRRELRYVLGHPPALSVADARKAVQARVGAVVIGQSDPFKREARKKSDLTLRKVFEDYLASRDLKERTLRDYRERVEEECFSDWLDRPVANITRDDVDRRFAGLAAKSESRARGGMVVLRALFNFAQAKYEVAGRPVIVDNPTKRLTATRRGWSAVKRRSTAIPLNLMPGFFTAASALDNSASDYLQAVALTGARREEMAKLEWRCVDLDGGTFHFPETKNRQPLHLPITRQLRALFERRKAAQKGRRVWRYVFNQDGPQGVADQPLLEPRKTLDAICAAINYESTVHDLRRSFINAADASGQGFIVTKLLVNHRLPTGSDDVTVGYGTADAERLRRAAQRVADILDGTVGVDDNIVQIGAQR